MKVAGGFHIMHMTRAIRFHRTFTWCLCRMRMCVRFCRLFLYLVSVRLLVCLCPCVCLSLCVVCCVLPLASGAKMIFACRELTNRRSEANPLRQPMGLTWPSGGRQNEPFSLTSSSLSFSMLL